MITKNLMAVVLIAVTALSIAIGSTPAQSAEVEAQTIQIIGTATPLHAGASESVVYEELHTLDAAGLHRSVSYRHNGREFASKTVNYAADAIAPDFMQQDMRRGEMIAARRDGQGRIELGYREKTGAPERWQRLESSVRPLVIDAGFDNFVRRQWGSLLQGDAIHIDFAVPSRTQAVHLVIVSTRVSDCAEPRIRDGHCLRVYAGNYLVRLFFGPLHLLYDNDGQLQRFMGLSNINDGKGDGQQLRIDYRRAPSP
jgi:hypothetical protein